MTSGIFTFTLTVTEGEKVEYSTVFHSEPYHLSFTEMNGKVKVRGVSQQGDVHLFDITINDGTVCLSENGLYLDYRQIP